jgi:hypothetical protein
VTKRYAALVDARALAPDGLHGPDGPDGGRRQPCEELQWSNETRSERGANEGTPPGGSEVRRLFAGQLLAHYTQPGQKRAPRAFSRHYREEPLAEPAARARGGTGGAPSAGGGRRPWKECRLRVVRAADCELQHGSPWSEPEPEPSPSPWSAANPRASASSDGEGSDSPAAASAHRCAYPGVAGETEDPDSQTGRGREGEGSSGDPDSPSQSPGVGALSSVGSSADSREGGPDSDEGGCQQHGNGGGDFQQSGSDGSVSVESVSGRSPTANPRFRFPVQEVELELLTGRTHQIRGQMACAGVPLLGDAMYTHKALAAGSTEGLLEWPAEEDRRMKESSALALQSLSLTFPARPPQATQAAQGGGGHKGHGGRRRRRRGGAVISSCRGPGGRGTGGRCEL